MIAFIQIVTKSVHRKNLDKVFLDVSEYLLSYDIQNLLLIKKYFLSFF